MEENREIHIEDGSGDKDHFTIIPNYVLNHSTHWDREIYIQMKKIAGESGTCWTSRKTLSEKCGMSISKLGKSLKYLVENKWIEKVGEKKIITEGGMQETNEYKITNLWEKNSEYYAEKNKGRVPQTLPTDKGRVPQTYQGRVPQTYKEEPSIKEEPIIDSFQDLQTPEQEIFHYWNSKNIVIHRMLRNDMKSEIKKSLKLYPINELKYIIDLYDIILKGEEYFWSYKWNLIDFLRRGLKQFEGKSAQDYLINKAKTKAGGVEMVTKDFNRGEIITAKDGKIIKTEKMRV